jgi:hypothetical protein
MADAPPATPAPEVPVTLNRPSLLRRISIPLGLIFLLGFASFSSQRADRGQGGRQYQ